MNNANSVGMSLDPNIKLKPTEESKLADLENSVYASLVRSLMYMAIATCPDIAYVVHSSRCLQWIQIWATGQQLSVSSGI